MRDLAEDSSCDSDTDCESDLAAVLLGIRLSISELHTSSGATLTRPRCGKKGAYWTRSTALGLLPYASGVFLGKCPLVIVQEIPAAEGER